MSPPPRQVLVISEDPEFLDRLGHALQDAGMLATCVADVEGAMDAVDDDFRPEAVVVDRKLVSAPERSALVQHLHRLPELQDVPVFVKPALRTTCEIEGAVPVERDSLDDLLGAIRLFDDEATRYS